MKKSLHIFCALLTISLVSTAQPKNWDLGIFLGGSYYNGEFNPSKHVVVSQPAVGIFFDQHLNSRYSLRYIATYGKLKADDNLFDYGLNNFRDMAFETNVIDVSGQLHFNFLPFGNTLNVKPYTPYIFIGLSIYNVNPELTSLGGDSVSVAYPKVDSEGSFTSVAVPFGLGFKAISGNFTFGLEWNFRKTWSDRIDGNPNQYAIGNTYDDPIQFNQPQGFQNGYFNTDDWYSFIGFTISYRPSAQKNACPAMD